MNEKCKYCDYVSKCSRKCEYNSILCRTQRSFPKVVDKSYEQLQQENKQLKDNWNKLKEYLHNVDVVIDYSENYDGRFINYDELIDKMQEIEQGSDSNENNNI